MEPGSLLTMSFGFLYITHLPKMEKLVLQIALRVVELPQKLLKIMGGGGLGIIDMSLSFHPFYTWTSFTMSFVFPSDAVLIAFLVLARCLWIWIFGWLGASVTLSKTKDEYKKLRNMQRVCLVFKNNTTI